MRDIPLRGRDEQDALTGWKRFFCFKAKTRSKIKEGFNRRERRLIRKRIKANILEYTRESREGGKNIPLVE